MLCSICQSDSFNEDGQGFFFCSMCGTQSQDYFAESFENEHVLGGKIRSRQVKTPQPVKASPGAPQLYDYLVVFQAMLRLMMRSVGSVAHVNGLEDVVKDLWFSYLTLWNQQNERSMMAHFTAATVCSDTGEGAGLPIPSKPLLLGMVYLGCRLLRSWVTPGDIVRWCEQGQVPYFRVWDLLPERIQGRVLGREGARVRLVFGRVGQGTVGALSPTNIFFHSVLLANSLRFPLPPLNAPLVISSTISGLGLPSTVWDMWVVLSRLFSRSAPLPCFQAVDMHHAEDLVAGLVVACRLVRGCVSGWNVVPLGRPFLPGRISEMDNSITPRTLSGFLFGLRAAARSIDDSKRDVYDGSGFLAFNKVLEHVLEEQWECLEVTGSVGDTEECTVGSRGVSLSSRTPADSCHLTPLDSKHKNFLLGRVYSIVPTDEEMYSLLSYAVADDITGVIHPGLMALCERCSRHLCAPPGLLWELVCGVDRAVFAAVLGEKAIAHESKEVDMKTVRALSKIVPVSTGGIGAEDMGEYMDHVGIIFPMIRKFGSEGWLEQRSTETVADLATCDSVNDSDAEDGAGGDCGDAAIESQRKKHKRSNWEWMGEHRGLWTRPKRRKGSIDTAIPLGVIPAAEMSIKTEHNSTISSADMDLFPLVHSPESHIAVSLPRSSSDDVGIDATGYMSET
mmetsp:Transcript_7700/g.11425  ORF Transcript_7700/g.11425 Transcript_7700/m.11425 type:complete len:677 (-) Transcript_7700:293-2323(-)